MQIVADENIPLLDQFFSEFGDITRVSGRDMTAADVADAEVLIVRSVTKVTEALLAGSKVRFVGTATIGTDHIDLEYLKEKGIGFRSAPGCNAQAVVDYVLSALSVVVDSRGVPFTDMSVGIIGLGNVGSLLRNRLEEMGMTVIGVDPFKDPEDVGELSTLEEALKADIVTLHTPMSRVGEHPTWHMINADTLSQMKPDACLINAARGAVVDNSALLEHLKANEDFLAILDTWENEPTPNLELLNHCMLGTPHIAGYSLDGKMRGTEAVYHGVSEYYGLPIRRKLAQFLPEPGVKKVTFTEQVPIHQALRTAIRAAYEIRVDDGVMRAAFRRSKDIAKAFDALRKEYPLRRDTPNLRVGVPSRAHDLRDALQNAGFDVRTR
ncbi:MAG: 4-phosphoerythronate dehydrogenase PdxB [Oleibacter sp.]|nr:4-phosphoerythronate dehydrogenase PdxB [Thalassolituus sp.]